MRTFKVSDELYEQLKSFVIDPFDDTPDVVIARLIEIVRKARNRWSPFDPCDAADQDTCSLPVEPPQEHPPQAYEPEVHEPQHQSQRRQSQPHQPQPQEPEEIIL
jgi:hypothetical protein